MNACKPLAALFALLRERIEKGEAAQLFAPADTEHPRRLAAAHIHATPDTLLQTLLRDDVRLGTSTPQSDPAGGYAWAMDTAQADVFLTYCTNALAAQQEVPRLQVLELPAALQVGAPYGLTMLKAASPQARAFADALLQAPARQVFQSYGFAAP